MAFVVILFVAAIVLFKSFARVKAEERAVVERLGRALPGARGPGLVFHVPFIDRLRTVSMARQSLEIRGVDVVTTGDAPVSVDLVLMFRVLDPVMALYEVSDYRNALAEMTRTSLRAVAKETTVHDGTIERKAVADRVRSRVESAVKPWGIGIETIEVTSVRSAG